MRDTEYVTGEDRLRELCFFRLKRAPVTLQYIKIVMKRIFIHYYLAVAENKRSK